MYDPKPVNSAFSLQASHFDADDKANQVIHDLRQQVYRHVARIIPSASNILELNAGTGIDAVYFIKQGHRVHATDLSDGMVQQLRSKAAQFTGQLSVQQLAYDNLNEVAGGPYDFVFSNFGGLNCIPDLRAVTSSLPPILKPGGVVTWIIMPPVCLWEVATILRGNTNAFRRWNRNGVMAHLEGEYFKTWYHSLSSIRRAFGNQFRLIKAEGLAAISPPPYRETFPKKNPGAYRLLRNLDVMFNSSYPFNRWADHIIVSFRYQGEGFTAEALRRRRD